MKASELISALQKLIDEHGDREVSTEGCDCIGSSGSVEFEADMGDDGGEFLINRS